MLEPLPPPSPPQTQETLLAQEREQAFHLWLDHPETRRYREFLRRSLTTIEEAFTDRQFVGDTLDQFALRHAEALGAARLLRDLIELKASDMEDTSNV